MKKSSGPKSILKIKISLYFLVTVILLVSAVWALFCFSAEQNIKKTEFMILLTFAAMIGIGVIVFLTVRLSASILDPLKVLLQAVNKLEKGDMKVRARVEADNEVGELAHAFNRMVKSIHRTNISVKMLNEDIAKRRKAQNALEESEKKFRGLVENLNDVVFQLSPEGVFQYVSPAMEKLLGFKNENIIGLYIGITTPPEDMPNVLYVLDSIKRGKGVQRWELNQLDKDGKKICSEITAGPLEKDGEVIAILGVMRDITERKKTEMQIKTAYNKLKETQSYLIQAEKLQVVGTLASAVAHEVKNPLGIILQGVDYLDGEMGDGEGKEKFTRVLGMIKDAVKRADNIVRGMLDFSRPSPVKLKRCNLNKIIRTSADLVGKQLHLQNVEIKMELASELPEAMIDANQMQQVFMNLILNAVHAMPKGGGINIKTYAGKLTEKGGAIGTRQTDLFKVGDTVVLCELEDTGTGIPKDKLDKVFDPFFSTKPAGKGTGLGLTIIRTIVDKHSGLIDIDSEEGKGTKFTITLPLDAEA